MEGAHHLHPIISDLGLILLTAGISVLLFKRLKQPLVLGYLIAGFLAGPYFKLFPTVKDIGNVEVWAEIGVIVLLFSLGLEFSFKKLMKVGGTASITASVQIVSMILIGFAAGQFLGWSTMDSIFLGAILSMSSTTIILRAFDELNVKGKRFAGIVFGALIVEDIVAILMMVLLSTIAVSQNFSGTELFYSCLKLAFFLILWFVGGIFIIPTFFKKAKNLFTPETLLIFSLALCFIMVILATTAGFSPALGAFIMGSIIAETTKAEKIEHLISPVKDLFGAIFFVSVGMLINPQTLVEYAVPVIVLTLVTIFGKTFTTMLGALLSGQPLKQSVQAGFSLAQIGEFSFIIATLGMTLGVTSKFLYPIVVAISAITTFTTPFMIKMSIPAYNKIEKILPKRWVLAIERYSSNTDSIKVTSNWQKVIKAHSTQIVIHSVIIMAIILISSNFLLPIVVDQKWGPLIATIITIGMLAPFIWALSFRKLAVEATEALRTEKKKSVGPLILLRILRLILGAIYIGMLINVFLSTIAALITLIVTVVLLLVFKRKVQDQYIKLESQFLSNFNDREISEASHNKSELTPWDGHMTSFIVPSESSFIGRSLYELQLREQIGINIAIIKRGNIHINVPNRSELLYPQDELFVIGTDEQVENFGRFLETNQIHCKESDINDISLKHIELKNDEFCGRTIRESQLREKTGGLIVGIEREGERLLNPESNMLLKKGDILWIVGDTKLLKEASI